MTGKPTIDDDLQEFLLTHRVQVHAPRDRMIELKAVPLGAGFSKPCTNLLLWDRHRPEVPSVEALGPAWRVFVDDDLTYSGDDPARRSLFGGPRRKRWQGLTPPEPLQGDVNDVLLGALELLNSPLWEQFEESARPAGGEDEFSLDTFAATAGGETEPGWYGRRLDVKHVDGAAFLPTAAQAGAVDRIQRALMRVHSPTCPVVYGPSGSGKSTAARLAAGRLVEAGDVQNVFEISAASLQAGVTYEAERDERLTEALAVAAATSSPLVIFEQFDLLIVSSKVVGSVLADVIDRPLPMIGVTQPNFDPRRLRGGGALVRRLEMIRLLGAKPVEMPAVIEKRVRSCPPPGKMEIAPAAIAAAVTLSTGDGNVEPAGSLGLLESVLVVARQKGLSLVGPDEVYHVHSRLYESM